MESRSYRVACYGRYSTSMQREESLAAQVRAMKAYCEEKGWTIVRFYLDPAYSGATDKRPQFQQMIADSEKHEFDIVLVHQLSRFARSRHDSSIYKQRLRKNGVQLCSVQERLDGSPESILLEGLIEAINEYYIANIARESMKGMKENAYKALHNGGSPGLGYNVDKTKHIIINEEEAGIVTRIYQLCLSGYSCKNIADFLNEEGVRTKNGHHFSVSSVRQILDNEKYTGVYIFNRAEAKDYEHKRHTSRSKPPEEIIRVEGGIPAIISKEVWEAAQARIHNKGKKLRNTKTMYLLSGKVRCGCCGAVMNGMIRHRKKEDNFYIYICMTKASNCENLKEIDRFSLERQAVALVMEHCQTAAALSDLPQDTPAYRELLQSYIHSITVYRGFVLFRILVDGNIVILRRGRKAFKTVTQRCFRNKGK